MPKPSDDAPKPASNDKPSPGSPAADPKPGLGGNAPGPLPGPEPNK